MMQSQLFEPSWPLDHYNYSGIIDGFANQPGFSSSFTTEDSSEISIDSYFATPMVMDPDSLVEFPSFSDEKQAMETMMEVLDPISICGWMDESESDDHISSQLTSEADVWSPPCSVKEQSNSTMALNLPGNNNNMELDNQLVLPHLFTAYGEAMENGQKELTEVIAKCINEKINPLGESIERLAFNLFQTTENHQGGYYLRQQSSKNFKAAFKAFYQCYPYGRFAHFTANSAIFEAIPKDTEVVHIVDFDMAEGIQWPPMIEAISRIGKVLRVTSIKTEEENTFTEWRFEETRRRLCDHARSLGLNLQVEEITLENMSSEIQRMKNTDGFRTWMAFNCMVGLPHMGRKQSRNRVLEFLKMAKEILAYCEIPNGIIALGDGEEAEENLKTCPGIGYGSFFNNQLIRYQALLESMEFNFPVYLSEARIAMESLFVAPFICSESWFQKWKETREGQGMMGFEGWRMSKESLIEAKEIVNERESLYNVKVAGERENEMVLEWKGIPLVRVSTWV